MRTKNDEEIDDTVSSLRVRAHHGCTTRCTTHGTLDMLQRRATKPNQTKPNQTKSNQTPPSRSRLRSRGNIIYMRDRRSLPVRVRVPTRAFTRSFPFERQSELQTEYERGSTVSRVNHGIRFRNPRPARASVATGETTATRRFRARKKSRHSNLPAPRPRSRSRLGQSRRCASVTQRFHPWVRGRG